MKRIISALLLLCTIALCFVSCGDSDGTSQGNNNQQPAEKSAVEKVDDLILAISDADSCYAAINAFKALSAEEQERLSYKNLFKSRLETYNSDKRIRDYLMEEQGKKESDTYHEYLKSR